MGALRPACSRLRSFLWLGLALLGLCARSEVAGVTSCVRAGFLDGACYRRFLHLFRSSGVDLAALARQWVRLVLSRFRPLEVAGHRLVVADGLKVPKEGRRMPGVKSLHQESENNSKPEYIMGHSWQAMGLLVESDSGPVCVPLASRLHDGIKRGPGERRTLLDKLVGLFLPLAGLLEKPVILLADAYYASRKIVLPLLAAGHHLVTRVRSNAVAYRPHAPPARRRRGRPRVYGLKVRLAALWDGPGFVKAPSPAYGESFATIRFLVVDLVWRPIGRLVRFVLVEHPTRGRLILMTSLASLDPVDIVRLYSYRFKIEVSFKTALHTVGAYAYHFWLKAMPKKRRGSGTQYLHRATPDYRDRV
ncbi:MAG: transposase, partial [Anaerolineales bacterium]